jgi:hypothetical protein
VDGFFVDDQVLHATATTFGRIAGQLGATQQQVAGLTADTGRKDSDDAAFSLFGAAARLLSSVGEGTAADAVSLNETIRTYAETEANNQGLFA